MTAMPAGEAALSSGVTIRAMTARHAGVRDG